MASAHPQGWRSTADGQLARCDSAGGPISGGLLNNLPARAASLPAWRRACSVAERQRVRADWGVSASGRRGRARIHPRPGCWRWAAAGEQRASKHTRGTREKLLPSHRAGRFPGPGPTTATTAVFVQGWPCVLCAVGLARSSQSTRAVTHASPTHALALYPDVHTPRSPAPQRAAPQWLHPSPKNSVSGRLTLLSACIAQALDTLHKCDSHKIGNVLACHGRVREANLKPTWQPPGPVPACPRGLPTAGDAVQRSACVHAVLPKCMCCLLACLRACVGVVYPDLLVRISRPGLGEKRACQQQQWQRQATRAEAGRCWLLPQPAPAPAVSASLVA